MNQLFPAIKKWRIDALSSRDTSHIMSCRKKGCTRCEPEETAQTQEKGTVLSIQDNDSSYPVKVTTKR